MKILLLLLTLIYSTKLFAQFSAKIPPILPVADRYISYSDLNELKFYIITAIDTMMGFLAKEILKWWSKRNDTTIDDEKAFKAEVKDKLDELKDYAREHKFELEHLRETKTTVSDVHRIVKERMDKRY